MLGMKFRSFLTDEAGATAIEYALIGTLIAMAIVGTATILGGSLQGLFNNGTAEVLTDQAGKIN